MTLANIFLPKCDVIVPAYNPDLTVLNELIRTLTNQGLKEEQILIVDDNSKSPFLVNKYPKVRIHRLQKNEGPALARNIGISLTNRSYIIFLDSDCVPSTSWLNDITEKISDKSVGAVTGPYKVRNFENILSTLEYFFSRSNQLTETKVTDYLTTANLIIKRSIIGRNNIFQTLNSGIFKWRNYFNEDGQLTNYIKQKGLLVIWSDNASVLHYKKYTFLGLTKQQAQFVWGILHSNNQSTESATPILRKKLIAAIPSLLLILSFMDIYFLFASIAIAIITRFPYYKKTLKIFPLSLAYHLYLPLIWISVGGLTMIEILILKIFGNKKMNKV